MSCITTVGLILSTDVIQLTCTLKMTTTQVVETSVTVNNNSPHPTYEKTPGVKPFAKLLMSTAF